jgi:flagellar motor component MotA
MEKISQRKIVRKVKKNDDSDYHNVKSISFIDNNMLLVVDGKEYKFKLKDISIRLLHASEKEREAYKVIASGYGISWPLIDEDLSIDGLLKTYIELYN